VTTRRTFMGHAMLAALGAASSCGFDGRFEVGADGDVALGHMPRRHRRALRLLDRFGYGPTAADIARIMTLGIAGFVDQQLAPWSASAGSNWWRIRRVESLELAPADLYALTESEVVEDLRRGTILRAVYSENQLLERLVEFWNDHFNVYAEKEGCGRLLVVHDREVIRRHALGSFRELLRAVVTSPAMLVYLDGRTSSAGNPNENHARELLELHTLGVDGPYEQADVRALARALTGWRVRDRWRPGSAAFDDGSHDDGEKRVVGVRLEPGLGEDDVERLVERLATHPATVNRLAAKLCRRFVADEPAPDLVRRVATKLGESGGNIGAAVREIALSPEFEHAPPMLKRPYSFAISAIRALDATTDGGRELQALLRALGQLPFGHPTPDGYPDGARAWQAMLPARWSFALRLTSNRIEGTAVDVRQLDAPSAVSQILHRRVEKRQLDVLDGSTDGPELLALILATPSFQYQ
jgi:uncharacterized protein (DUF1800 family)